jgi:hypothetical protein
MNSPKKIKFIIGDVAMTFTPADVEAVIADWLRENPGCTETDMPPGEFADRCMKRLKAGARPTRTVLHN